MAQLVEQLIRNQQVEGSSPSIGSFLSPAVTPAPRLAIGLPVQRGVAQFGSAFGSGPKGRGFESRHFDTVKSPQRQWLRAFLCAYFKAFSLMFSLMSF